MHGLRDPRETEAWYGSLPIDQNDRTGLSYRRNRFYDPGSGQFTQADPIGIAGGLNLYGYANGDPVNFSDPFGLCPVPIACLLGALAGMGVEAGVQMATGDFNGPAIAIAGAAGFASGGLATAARVGAGIRAVGVATVNALQGEANALSTGAERDLIDVGVNLAVGVGASAVGQAVQADELGSGLSRWFRGNVGNRNLSISTRSAITDRLAREEELALVRGLVVGGLTGEGGISLGGTVRD